MRGRFHSSGSPRPWQAILFSPVGDGRRRRRGPDGVRLGMAAIGVLICWLATHADSHAEQVVATTLSSPPDGLRWLVTSLWWATSAGLVVILVLLAVLGRRWTALRDVAVSASPPGCSAFLPSPCSAPMAAVPPTTMLRGIDLNFPAVRMAVAVAVGTAILPAVARWVQRTIGVALVLLALTTVVSARRPAGGRGRRRPRSGGVSPPSCAWCSAHRSACRRQPR